MTTVSCSRTCGRTPGAHLKGLQTLAWLSIVVIASRAKHQAACFTQRLCKALGKGHVRHTAPLTPTSGTVLRVPFAGKQSPSISRPHASTSSQRVVRSYAVQEKTGTVTIEDNLSNPWAEDGWRGAYVSSQPPATQTAIVLGAHHKCCQISIEPESLLQKVCYSAPAVHWANTHSPVPAPRDTERNRKHCWSTRNCQVGAPSLGLAHTVQGSNCRKDTAFSVHHGLLSSTEDRAAY